MPEPESVRIEVAFVGGPIIGANVSPASADALERAVVDRGDGTLALDADDGRVTVVVSSIAYVRRFARDGRPGFGVG